MQIRYLVMGMLVIASLILAGCSDQNSSFESLFGDNNGNSGNSDTVTLIHATKMFDFSTGQYVTEDYTTEDIDAITITNEGKIRLLSHNNAEIKKQGDEEYSSYIDVAEGETCILKDAAGGIATITVSSIAYTSQNYPSCTITWSYSS